MKKLQQGLKINKPLSGLLVCWLIMSTVFRLFSKFHIFLRSLRFSAKSSFFRHSLYQPWTADKPATEGVYLLNVLGQRERRAYQSLAFLLSGQFLSVFILFCLVRFNYVFFFIFALLYYFCQYLVLNHCFKFQICQRKVN